MARFRPSLRFSLRTLFIVVTALSVPLGWLGYQLNWIRQRRDALASQWVYDLADSASVPAPRLLWMFDERGYAHLLVMRAPPQEGEWALADEVDLKRAAKLFPEAFISNLR